MLFVGLVFLVLEESNCYWYQKGQISHPLCVFRLGLCAISCNVTATYVSRTLDGIIIFPRGEIFLNEIPLRILKFGC